MEIEEKLDLDNVKMKDLSDYLSLTRYLKDYTREEIEAFYFKKRDLLDDENRIKYDALEKIKNDKFEKTLKSLYDSGFGPGTTIKKVSFGFFSVGSSKTDIIEQKLVFTGRAKKISWPDKCDVMFEFYEQNAGESYKDFCLIDESLTFIKELHPVKSEKTFEEVLASLDVKQYLYF